MRNRPLGEIELEDRANKNLKKEVPYTLEAIKNLTQNEISDKLSAQFAKAQVAVRRYFLMGKTHNVETKDERDQAKAFAIEELNKLNLAIHMAKLYEANVGRLSPMLADNTAGYDTKFKKMAAKIPGYQIINPVLEKAPKLFIQIENKNTTHVENQGSYFSPQREKDLSNNFRRVSSNGHINYDFRRSENGEFYEVFKTNGGSPGVTQYRIASDKLYLDVADVDFDVCKHAIETFSKMHPGKTIEFNNIPKESEDKLAKACAEVQAGIEKPNPNINFRFDNERINIKYYKNYVEDIVSDHNKESPGAEPSTPSKGI